jgi:polysaccharide biosynthesis transport protein
MKVQEERLEGLNVLFDEEREAAKQLASFQVKDEAFRSEIGRKQQLFSAVVKRLEEITLVKGYGGVKTQMVASPAPGKQIAPRLATALGMSCLLGLLAGVGLGWLVDLLDKRFRTPEEIRRNLGVPILGHIPVIESRGKAAAASAAAGATASLAQVLCVVHRPKGRQAEAYRGVRTAMYFSARAQGHKVIQVTSPNPGDGKTTTATNLALSIAESGRKVLLIDADFRRPRVHKYLGLDNSVGLQAAVAADAELSDVIQSTAVENLWAITSGGRPSNPAELLTSARFKELLDVVKEQYDFVIVDCPPVLAVTDASAVAPRVDAVIMVIRLTKNARASALHAVETLASLGAKILGVVVNGLASGTSSYGGYGYGNYSYGYGYGRGYGYGYRYGEGKGYEESHRVYYADDNPQDGGNGDVFDDETANGETAKQVNGNGKAARKHRQETKAGSE